MGRGGSGRRIDGGLGLVAHEVAVVVQGANDRVMVQKRHHGLQRGAGSCLEEPPQVLQAQGSICARGQGLGAGGVDVGRPVGAGQAAQAHNRTQGFGAAFFHQPGSPL
jgi:hypothetical protein